MTSERIPAEIALENVTVAFGKAKARTLALQDVSLHVRPGEFVSIVGPSGCGKSTVLNVLAGFQSPTSGRATIDGKPILGPGPELGVVFQQYSLFPWLKVRENVEYGLRMQGVSRHERQCAARTLLGMAGLLNFENHYPSQLSGGMRQRVGIIRALAANPRVLLMDEPFGALDSQTRSIMQEILLDIWGKSQLAVLFITHDIEEAVFLSDRVHVMSSRPGRISASFDIPLPRPRRHEQLAEAGAALIASEIRHLIRTETIKAMGSSWEPS
jgi:NitT/TauT family transport system ATP-binding protein